MKRLFSWNVNGIRACERKGLIDGITKEQPDVLAIQETKARPEQLSEELLNIDGYKNYFYIADRKGYSGVAIYTKEEPLSVEKLGLSDYDDEGRVMIAKYPEFTLVNCYFPNSQVAGKRLEYKIDFCKSILDKCNALIARGENVVLCGDYNIAHKPIDLKNPDSNEHNPGYLPEERAWMTKFLNAGYADVFRQQHPDEPGHYTWWSYRFQARSKDIGWRIDYFCVNNDFADKVKNASIHKFVLGSDHCPVSIELDV